MPVQSLPHILSTTVLSDIHVYVACQHSSMLLILILILLIKYLYQYQYAPYSNAGTQHKVHLAMPSPRAALRQQCLALIAGSYS